MEAASDIIRFAPNVPVTLTMKYDGTKPCKSRYNDEDQFMLTTTDGRVAFLTPYANACLEAAGVRRGDQIAITQTVRMNGQRKTVDWVITKAGAETQQGSAATVAPVAAPPVPAKTDQGVNQNAVAIASVPAVSRPATQLEDALRTALVAAKTAEQFGQEIGYFVKFDKDDVRSMAITLLIGKQQRGER